MPTPVPVATIIVCVQCLLLSLALIKHKMALGFGGNELAIAKFQPLKKQQSTEGSRDVFETAGFLWSTEPLEEKFCRKKEDLVSQ